MRKGPTSDAQERIFSWFALSLMPFLSVAISGGVLGLGNMVFTAALTAGVLQLLLIYGMLGITGTYRLAGNAQRKQEEAQDREVHCLRDGTFQ